jgi:hypothetical protein
VPYSATATNRLFPYVTLDQEDFASAAQKGGQVVADPDVAGEVVVHRCHAPSRQMAIVITYNTAGGWNPHLASTCGTVKEGKAFSDRQAGRGEQSGKGGRALTRSESCAVPIKPLFLFQVIS